MDNFAEHQPPKFWQPPNQAIFFLPFVALCIVLFTIGGAKQTTVVIDSDLQFNTPGYWRSAYVTRDALQAGELALTNLNNYINRQQNQFARFAEIRWVADSNDGTNVLIISVWRYRPAGTTSVPGSIRGYMEQQKDLASISPGSAVLSSDTFQANGLSVHRLDVQVVDNSTVERLTLREIQVGVQTRTQDYLFIIVASEGYYQANADAISMMIESLTGVQSN